MLKVGRQHSRVRSTEYIVRNAVKLAKEDTLALVLQVALTLAPALVSLTKARHLE